MARPIANVDSNLNRAERRAKGVYYTPQPVAAFIVRQALAAWRAGRAATDGREPVILEPSCGAGVFLLECARQGRLSPRQLWGRDTDEAAIDLARAAAAKQLGVKPRELANVVAGDALDDPRLRAESFDLIVGNPPYVNVRQLPKQHSAEKINDWRERFRTARGNFDLYVLFFERAIEQLKPGGVCAFIVPNKLAALDYARACRALLLEQTIVEITDLSALNVFPAAGVYPYVVVVRKESPRAGHRMVIRTPTSLDDLPSAAATKSIPQSIWSADRFTLSTDLDVESRVTTKPLGECCDIHSGASGYSAQSLAALIHERNERVEATDPRDFIVSGNIDPYTIRDGNVRFLGRQFERPTLDIASAGVTSGKRELYSAPKIVIAGLSARLEAAWDDRGRALGVQVFALTKCHVDPFYLLGLLNSQLFTALFRTRFAAKKLAGNYFAVNKGQLVQLPVALAAKAEDVPCRQSVARLARRLHEAGRSPVLETEIDRLVEQLYRVSAEELASLEAASLATVTQRATRRAA